MCIDKSETEKIMYSPFDVATAGPTLAKNSQ